MIQKEVTDKENTRWNCVQAFSQSDNPELAEKAKELSNGKVDVVCTPTGGAQSVRLQLDENWQSMSDEALVQLINENQ